MINRLEDSLVHELQLFAVTVDVRVWSSVPVPHERPTIRNGKRALWFHSVTISVEDEWWMRRRRTDACSP